MLDLGWNKIEDVGSQYLADVLRNNQAWLISIHFSHISLPLYLQTLIRLDLNSNEIGDIAGEYLASGLRDNIVIFLTFTPLIYLSIFIFTSHLLDCM